MLRRFSAFPLISPPTCEEYGSFCEYQLSRPQDAASKVKDRGKDLIPIQPRHPLQLISNPSDSILCEEAEARYFQIFHEKLAFDLSGYFEAPFWTRLIPQQCHHNPGIKHAILALSALYKSALSSTSHTVNLNDEHYSFALVQQRQAIISLRNDMSSGQPQMRIALVASLLFSCFESFHGDWETATQQVYNGFNILKRLSEDERQEATNSLADIELDVGLTLRRLELQILSFLAMTPMMEHPNDLDFNEVVLDLPEQFTTFNEAFTAVTKLAVSILRHAKISAQCEDDSGRHRDFLARQRQHLQRLMDQWGKAYEPMFLKACQNTVCKEHLGVLQVRICAWKCEILIATSMSDTEAVFDDFTARFQRMTHFARYVLQKDQELRDSDGPRLQYGMGLIMALFFTATRCRNFFVRREAIAILREWPCTNGIWHSLQAAKVAEWIISIEDERCSELEFVPKRLPAGIEQLRNDIERKAASIMKKHGLEFQDKEEYCRPQLEMRGVPETPTTGLPHILMLAPWSTEKQRDWEQPSPTNGTIGCFVQLKTCDPEPTWRTFILTSYQAVRPAFDGLNVIPNGAYSSVAPSIPNSDLWTVDSVGYTPDSSAKPTTFESPSRSKYHFRIRDIDQEIVGLTEGIQYLKREDTPSNEETLQELRGMMAALTDERKQKTEFWEANKQALGRLYAASGFRRRVVGRRMDWALIEFHRPWYDRLPGFEEWESTLYNFTAMPYMTFGMQLEEQARSLEALSGLAWESRTFDVYKVGASGGLTVGSLLCTNNLVTMREYHYMNPSPTEEMAFEPKRYTYAREQGFCAPGDSGSVVFDGNGGIVGLMTGGHRNNNSYNHGYGHVTPIEYVLKDIKDLLKGHVLGVRIAEL
ncbi:dihydrolipoyl dehydrogenase [Fusarium sp. NRRL 52700]|nr:dihydrolipoyl dehydrogenase [Fusarium sp. NRRL 52700]